MQKIDDHIQVRLARDDNDLRAAQRLRHQVFVQEMGAHDGPGTGLETDRFDRHCDHLVLVDQRRNPVDQDHVVGVYRMLGRDAAVRAGGFYSEQEYDLSPLVNSGRTILELGRSCVHADYRNGLALYRLWHGLGAYVERRGVDLLFGVASFPGIQPAAHAHALSFLHQNHLAPADIRVQSRAQGGGSGGLLPPEAIDKRAAVLGMPALIKAYLRIGGYVGQGYFVDHSFNTTDVCLLLDTTRMSSRQRHQYSGGDLDP